MTKRFGFHSKLPRYGWDQSLADFNRFSSAETRSCYYCLVLYPHGGKYNKKDPYLNRAKFSRGKANPLIQTVVHRSNIYYFKIHQKENWKNIQFPLEQQKNSTSQAPSSTLHLEQRTRYFRYEYSIKISKNKMDSKVI